MVALVLLEITLQVALLAQVLCAVATFVNALSAPTWHGMEPVNVV